MHSDVGVWRSVDDLVRVDVGLGKPQDWLERDVDVLHRPLPFPEKRGDAIYQVTGLCVRVNIGQVFWCDRNDLIFKDL